MPANAHNQSVETGIAYQHIRTAAKHEDRQIALIRPCQRLHQFGGAGCLHKIARRSANAPGCIWSKRFVFETAHTLFRRLYGANAATQCCRLINMAQRIADLKRLFQEYQRLDVLIQRSIQIAEALERAGNPDLIAVATRQHKRAFIRIGSSLMLT